MIIWRNQRGAPSRNEVVRTVSYLRLTAEQFIFRLLGVSEERVPDHAEHLASGPSSSPRSAPVSPAPPSYSHNFSGQPLGEEVSSRETTDGSRVASGRLTGCGSRSRTERRASPCVKLSSQSSFLLFGDTSCRRWPLHRGMIASASALMGGVCPPPPPHPSLLRPGALNTNSHSDAFKAVSLTAPSLLYRPRMNSRVSPWFYQSTEYGSNFALHLYYEFLMCASPLSVQAAEENICILRSTHPDTSRRFC